MEKLAARVLICSLLAALLLLSSPARSQEVEDEHEFNYDEKSEQGPSHWGDIKPEWRKCNTGKMQSPIDLLNERVQVVSQLGPIQLNYRPSNATLKNRGHDIMLEWRARTSYLQINGTKYELKQYHWHSPSEHTVDGKRFDLELHMVHQTPSNQTAVIGVLYNISSPDPFLSLLTKDLEAITETTGAEREVGVLDPRLVNIERTQYYRYLGSLTTPPCTENVTWTIVKEVRPVAREQVNLLRVAVHDESDTNARPLQPTNNRLVQLNKPKDHPHY